MNEPSIPDVLFGNPEAETGIVSCVMQGADCDPLSPDWFANPARWVLFCAARQHPGDMAALVVALRDEGLLASVGGPAEVVNVFRFAPSAAQIGYYLKIAKAARLRRRIRAFGASIKERAEDPDPKSDELAEAVECEALMLREDVSAESDDIPSMAEALRTVMETIQNRVIARQTGKLPGIASGLIDLDATINGFQPGRVYVFGARPGMGKTSLIRQILLHAARTVPVYLLNLEMSVAETLEAMLSTEGSVDYGKLQGGDLGERDFGRIHHTVERMLKMPIHVDDRMLTAARIEATVRRMVRTRKVGIFAIDYLQLVSPASKEEERSPLLKITNASNALVRIAKENRIPVIAIVQLNREAEDTPAAQLSRAYIRDCGQIEQDASFIGLLGKNNPSKSGKPKRVNGMGQEIPDDETDDSGPKRIAIKIAKNRQGQPDGLIPLVFRGQYLKFETQAHEHE